MKFLLISYVSALGCLLLSAEANSNWSTLGNSSNMHHHTDLEQINKSNLNELGIIWSVDLPTQDGLVGNPLISNGRIFQSGSFSRIFANDLKTGELLWVFDPIEPSSITGSLMDGFSTRVNRGVALYEDLVIVAARCNLVAVNQVTGIKEWESQSCDPEVNWTAGAPRIGGDMVFIGNSGLDGGLTRGFVDAFDARTGTKLWRFYTVPGDPSESQENKLYEMALKTWGEGWYKNIKGGGNVWEAMIYDKKSNLLYLGVGGSALDPRSRGKNIGDELFTNSIVALNAENGEYVWHFKMNPLDGWNYEPSVGLMIADLPLSKEGKNKRVILSVPKNGFVYILDAASGKYISSNNYVDVNWATGHDKSGRPIYNDAAKWWTLQPGEQVRITPGALGSHSFDALAFDPQKKTLFIPAQNLDYYLGIPKNEVVGLYGEYGFTMKPTEDRSGKLIAWDPLSQKELWSITHAKAMNGGLLHTASGIVFQGTAEGVFKAYDSLSGEEIWSREAGGAMRAAPSSVMADDQQLIIVSVGRGTTSAVAKQEVNQASNARSRSQPRLIAFGLGGDKPTPAWASKYYFKKPMLGKPKEEIYLKGANLFHDYGCEGCHGIGALSIGGDVPDLRKNQYSKDYFRAVMDGALISKGMPEFSFINDLEADAINSFLLYKSWEAFENDATEINK